VRATLAHGATADIGHLTDLRDSYMNDVHTNIIHVHLDPWMHRGV
jgi:hypothetical protein